MKINLFWFRRDLRIEDNTALSIALSKKEPVLALFIFDENITDKLACDDARITFIYNQLRKINDHLKIYGSSLLVLKGSPKNIFNDLILQHQIANVFSNKDYEPYALSRDHDINELLKKNYIDFIQAKDSVVFEPHEILKDNGDPYTVYTPYKNKWLKKFSNKEFIFQKSNLNNFLKKDNEFYDIEVFGFKKSKINVVNYNLDILNEYSVSRDFPSHNRTSYLGIHLRFGTVSVREIINKLSARDDVFLSELIWREFFMQILFHFPKVVDNNFKSKYDSVIWRNDKDDFDKWCRGETGYPIVDAGMRQLNTTGYMHNRVRMLVAGFLCKHLLIDWKWGERYFAEKLLDFELASNNGNWQWAAGTGCDSAPYFRIFNPITQQLKFDKSFTYINQWIENFEADNYIPYMVDHKMARERALFTYKKGLAN